MMQVIVSREAKFVRMEIEVATAFVFARKNGLLVLGHCVWMIWRRELRIGELMDR